VAHRFRFFVDQPLAIDETVTLGADDVKHLKVIRADAGEIVDLVDSVGVVFDGEIVDSRAGTVRPIEVTARGGERWARVHLYVGADMSGNRWDALVDGAVQAGVARITPVVDRSANADRMAKRIERSKRIVRSAAAQSKRSLLPVICDPTTLRTLAATPGTRIVCDPDATVSLHDVVVALNATRDIAVFVGAPDGIEVADVQLLVDSGWSAAGMGPLVLRSELAAALAVATCVQVTMQIS
jgi:16S rRNA (uracil1498-N3)-methyltransferase